MQRIFLLWLMLLPITVKQRSHIWAWAQARQAYRCNLAWMEDCGFSDTQQQKLKHWYTQTSWSTLLGHLQNVPTLTILDDAYPFCLKMIAQPPLVLFYAGDLSLLKRKTVAIVGSRQIQANTLAVLKTWVPELVRQGYTVISGNAAGVDSVVHRLVLGQRGQTIAVIGTGLDYCYPKTNSALQKYISEVGLVLSEYLPWFGPKQWHFPERNRIIVGLTQDVFICQAAQKSGTMVTAEIALDENRNLWVLPGNVLDPAYAGSFDLIREGAQILIDVTDFTQGNDNM
ncbi:DNA-processing protein DprA [Weissella viridescens]|nr:DNA-processing protein DprA [Weissella viridescens]